MVTHFGDDERLPVLQPSFQREPPRRAPAQLDLNVVEGDELLHGFHPSPSAPCIRFPLVFFVLLSVLLLRLAAPVAVPLLLHHRCNINEERMDWLRKKDGGSECKRGRAESFNAGLKVSNSYSEMSLSTSG